VSPEEHVPLAPYCTLGVGGSARFFVDAEDEASVVGAWMWGQSRGVPLSVLGGGSNLVIGDAGVNGLVVRVGVPGVETADQGHDVVMSVGAGEPWDPLVALTVECGWAGLECLSGIPGLVGATPIQNVGAYGQEVAETLVAVRALDTRSGRVVSLTRAECRFAYRDSLFKSGEPGRFIVLAVTFRLRRHGEPTLRYDEVARHLAARGVGHPSLADVRASVLAIRRSKSMVIDAGDENARSCGSFFTNPIVTVAEADRIQALTGEAVMPRYPQSDGRVKLAAAWLIEHAGFRKGQRQGAVGLSTRHALAVVAHAGATASDVVGFARRVQRDVEARFGVRLTPEPVFWGV
jgi:UDP-N-acetylmuramate dehydrogenase